MKGLEALANLKKGISGVEMILIINKVFLFKFYNEIYTLKNYY